MSGTPPSRRDKPPEQRRPSMGRDSHRPRRGCGRGDREWHRGQLPRHPRPFGTDPQRSAWRSDGEAGGAAVDAPAWPGGRSRYPAVQVCGGEQLVLGRLDQGQVGGGDQDHQGGQEQRAAPLRSEAGRASARPGSRMEDDQRGKQGERLDHHTHALTCCFGARGRIRTDDLPITSRRAFVQRVPPRPVLAAQVSGVVQPVRS